MVNQPQSRPGVGTLIGHIITLIQELVIGEVELAKAQVKEKVAATRKGVILIAVAAVTGFFAIFLFLAWLIILLTLSFAAALGTAYVFLVLLVLTGLFGLLGVFTLKRAARIEIKPSDRLKEAAKETAATVVARLDQDVATPATSSSSAPNTATAAAAASPAAAFKTSSSAASTSAVPLPPTFANGGESPDAKPDSH